MKRKQRIVAIIILCTALVVMGIVQCFAWDPGTNLPNDLGEKINSLNNVPNGFYYIKITLKTDEANDIFTFEFNRNTTINYAKFRFSNNGTNGKWFTFELLNNIGDYGVIKCLNYPENNNVNNIYLEPNRTTYYFCWAISCIKSSTNNCTFNIIPNTEVADIEIYYMGNTGLKYNEVYNSGYTNGYNTGFDEGQNIEQYTNLVGYVEQLIGQFTGNEAAQYITPIAIVLVILFVYFLFIRFLLSLIKAKGVIKTCDIIMIVACIIMLVVMYAPKLDLTIKTEQINTTETTQVVEQINRTQIRIEHTETGDIYYGPVGTAIVPVYEIASDTVTKQVNTESEKYEKG